MLMQCMVLVIMLYDVDYDGKNDMLWVYGFGVVFVVLYKVKGVMVLILVVQKVDLKVMGVVVEVLNGVWVWMVKGEGSVDSIVIIVRNNEFNFFNVVVEIVYSVMFVCLEVLLCGGCIIGYCFVSFGEQGLCVVLCYELLFDQCGVVVVVGVFGLFGGFFEGGGGLLFFGFFLFVFGLIGDF